MILVRYVFFMSLFLLIGSYGCEGKIMNTDKKPKPTIKDVQPSSWERLAAKKISFGHQSVGDNIMSGISDLMREYPTIKLRVLSPEDAVDFSSGFFLHYTIGQNGKPETKIQDFVRKMDHSYGGKVDIALFKFCFVDITSSTDVQALFAEYTKTMSMLKNKYPETVFIHCTVPLLKKSKTTPKSLLKKLLGNDDGFFDNKHNIARNNFNDLIRKEYLEEGLIFDIAAAESTYPDGSRETFSSNGGTYYSLIPDYTDDGGHLNALGRVRVAEKLLLHLVMSDSL